MQSIYIETPCAGVQPQPIALLVPGIGISYSKALKQLRDNSLFRTNCAIAGIDDFRNADSDTLRDYEHFLHDNLDNQKLSYVVNCSMSDLYKRRGIFPKFVVGYSMGIYAALYAGGYCSFETGLRIVEKAFRLIRECCLSRPQKYSMGLILGLKEKEIQELLLKKVEKGVDIAVHNGQRNFVLAGEKEKLDFCLKKAVEIGALGVKPILTEHPYHTILLKEICDEFTLFLESLHYSVPVSSVLSSIDGKVVTKEDVADTIQRAICTPLHLELVIDALVYGFNVSVCYETGPALSMKKLARYINKKLKVYSFDEEPVQ